MDAHELMAMNLETAQQKRYRLYPKKIDFWSETEQLIFATIKDFRNMSETYHADNL